MNLTNSISEVINTFISDHLILDVILIVVATTMIIVSMVVDLISGISKARKNGEATTSTGLKKTCEKARKYFGPYIVLVCIDFITCVVIPIPAFSLLWAAYCIFCEFKSVREKAWKKEELRKAERTMSIIIENKDDIAGLVAKLLADKLPDKTDI